MEEFKEVIGYDYIKVEFKRILDLMKNPDKYFKLGVKTPKGLLLYGEPGTGKTLMANSFINESGWNSYICRKKDNSDNFLKVITNTFKKAIENQPAIILFDDLDKYANDDYEHQNSDEFIAIQTLMDECADYKIFLIATANEIENIPDSLLRPGRLDKVIEIETPKGKEAEEIIKYYISQIPSVGDVDIRLISDILRGYTCSDLKNVINEAGIYAGSQNKDRIDTDDIVKACMRIIFEAPESLDNVDYENLKRKAYHEAGHAVVSEELYPNAVCLLSIKRHEGNIGGITLVNDGMDYLFRAEDVLNKAIVGMGGKAAIDIIFNEYDVGAGNDLRRCSDNIQRLVQSTCVDGLDKYEIEDFEHSDKYRERVEKAIYDRMQYVYDEAKNILIKNRKFLEKLSEALLEKITLTKYDIQNIKEACKL